MKTGVEYLRYSSDRQTEQSIEGQKRVCDEFAKRNDIVIVDTYIDRAMTGTNDNREAFQQMLKDSDKKAWDFVLVYKLDRFSRNKYEMAIHRKHLKDNGIKILSAMENIPDTPEGILLESLLEGMNQYYSEELSQKSKRGLRETRMKGLFPGGWINYGYDVVDRKVVINETEAKITKRIFTEYANGKRLLTLAEELKTDGIVNKKGVPFSPESMYYMLHLERYAGRYTVNGILYDNIFPRIIPEEIFQQVQKRLEANRHGKHVPGVEYILKGKLFCECGNPMRSAGGKSRGKKQYRYYRCFSARRVKGCKDKTFRKDILENLVVSALVDQVTTEKNLNFLTERLLIKLQQDTAEAQTLKTLEKALAQTNKSLSNLLKAIENGIFSDTTKTRLDELETQKKALTEKLLIEKNKERSVPTTDEIKKYLKYAIQKTPRNLVELLVEKIIVYMDKIEIFLKYHGEPHTTPPHNDNNPDGTDNSDRGFLITEFLTTNLTSSEYYTYKKWAKREFLIRILL